MLLEIIRWEKGCLFWTFPLICGKWRKIKLSTCTIFQRIPATFGLFSLEVGYQEGRHFLCSPWTSRSRSKTRPLRSMIDFLNGKDLSAWLLQIATWTDSTLDRLWSSLTRPCINNHQLDDYCWKGAIEEVLFIYIYIFVYFILVHIQMLDIYMYVAAISQKNLCQLGRNLVPFRQRIWKGKHR